MRLPHRILFMLALLSGLAGGVRAAEPVLPPLPADQRWLLHLDLDGWRALAKQHELMDPLVARGNENVDLGNLLRLIRDISRATVSGVDANRDTHLLIMRLSPDAPPWVPLVSGQPDYQVREREGHSVHSWQADADKATPYTMHAAQVGPHVYLARRLDSLTAAIAAADGRAPTLRPAQLFAGDWPENPGAALLLLRAAQTERYDKSVAPDSGIPPGITGVSLTIADSPDGLRGLGILTARDLETAKRFHQVVQGFVSFVILDAKTPAPVRRMLELISASQVESQVRIQATCPPDQLRAFGLYLLETTATPPSEPETPPAPVANPAP